MRKDDECNPLHTGGSANKASQKTAGRTSGFSWWSKAVDRFVYRFVFCVLPRKLQTFLQNESTVELEDVKGALWEVLQVNIIHSINFGNDRQLQETRRFLEKCRHAVSLSCELTDFLEAVAQRKGETLAVAKKHTAKAAREIAKLFEFREQSVNMSAQLKAYMDEIYPEEVLKELELSALSNSDDEAFIFESENDFQEEEDFERDLALSYVEAILLRWAEGNEVLADIAAQYWDYLPIEVQKYLLDDIEFQLNLRNQSFSRVFYKYVDEAIKTYMASVSRAENSISRAKALNKSMPKVRLTELDKRCLTDNTDRKDIQKWQNPLELDPPQGKSYTLEELLEEVTPENSHEATDWGKPVGNEVW